MTLDFDVGKLSEAVRVAFESEHPDYTIPDPPDELFVMYDFLPEFFQDDSENAYIDALSLATQTSFQSGLYQFAYIQYHMQFMTSVYFVLLKLEMLFPDEVRSAIYYLLKDHASDFYSPSNTKAGKLYFGSFAAINESDVFLLLHIIGMDSDLLGQLQKLVETRNKYAHANGRLLLTSDELFIKEVKEYNRKIKKIFDLLRPHITGLYMKVVTQPDFYDPDIRAYSDPKEQIEQALVNEYSLSRVELNWLRKIRLSTFDDYPGSSNIKDLHVALMKYYDSLFEEEDQAPPHEEFQPFDDPYTRYLYHDKANDFITKELEISEEECAEGKQEYPLFNCPNCGNFQLVYDADTHRYHCFACDKNYTDEELSFCARCGSIMLRNDAVDICPACIDAISAE